LSSRVAAKDPPLVRLTQPNGLPRSTSLGRARRGLDGDGRFVQALCLRIEESRRGPTVLHRGDGRRRGTTRHAQLGWLSSHVGSSSVGRTRHHRVRRRSTRSTLSAIPDVGVRPRIRQAAFRLTAVRDRRTLLPAAEQPTGAPSTCPAGAFSRSRSRTTSQLAPASGFMS